MPYEQPTFLKPKMPKCCGTFEAGESVVRHPFLGEATMATLSSMSRERIAEKKWSTWTSRHILTYTLNMIKT
jgi:hypothetical protein